MDRHGLDATFSGEIFRKDHPMIIASRYDLSSIKAVRLSYDSSGYLAGVVLARNSVSGEYAKYSDVASSGLDTAACVLYEDVSAEGSSGTALARGIFGGEVFKSLLTGLDANGETDLKAKTIIDATGVQILKF